MSSRPKSPPRPPHSGPRALPRGGGWLRDDRAALVVLAVVVGLGAGIGAVGFRYLIFGVTWIFTGHTDFGQGGLLASPHFPGLGIWFIVLAPVVAGLGYGPLISFLAPETKGHGVPEVMLAVATAGGRIRPQVVVVKALASALCIGGGGSVGREGPIVQIGSALASAMGQALRLAESRMRLMVAGGAAAGISATFNAPLAGVFFGLEVILRELSPTAVVVVLISSMCADVVSQAFFGSHPFFHLPPVAAPHASAYLLCLLLGLAAGLTGVGFQKALFRLDDLWNWIWQGRPDWLRPGVGGIALGLLLLGLPQMYGVGYPVLQRVIDGRYLLLFLLALAAGKILACSLTMAIGGSGGIFAPCLFIGATLGMAYGELAHRLLGVAAGSAEVYAVVGMGAVFGAASRAPLAAAAATLEMTGDYQLVLPVMLGVAVATALGQRLSYGTIYTTKLLRRGFDLDALRREGRPPPGPGPNGSEGGSGPTPAGESGAPPGADPGAGQAPPEAVPTDGRPDRPRLAPTAASG